MFTQPLINTDNLNVHALWKYAVKPRVCRELTFGEQYTKHMAEEALMAIVFGYPEPLLHKVLQFSMPNERTEVIDIFNHKIQITIKNQNIIIKEI